jgi:Transposase DNA-binding
MRTTYSKRATNLTFGDTRLTRRFKEICGLFEQGLSQTIPQACLKKSQAKAVYRFFDHRYVTPQKMIATHHSEFETSFLNGSYRRLLQISDTVELDFTKEKGASQLGSLNYVHQKGMLLHNSMLISDLGLPLGLLSQSYTVRKDEDFGKSEARLSLPIEQKETYRWLEHFERGQTLCQKYPDIEVVYVADSEADIMELFQLSRHKTMHLVVRSKHDRLLADKSSHLYQAVSTQVAQGQYQIEIIHPHTQKERTATLEVRFCPVELTQHKQIKSKPNRSVVQFYAVQVREIDPPEDIAEPIQWFLLTTLPVTSFEEARQIIGYYVLRWIIERFHYLLKSGRAQVESLQLETAPRLQNAITAYSLATLKVLKIRYWAEKSPQSNIYEAGISPIEYEVLYAYAQKKLDPNIVFEANKPPSIAQYCKVLGQIGGFLPSKRQELPGLKIIARSLEKLKNLVDAYLIFCQRTE